VTRYTTYRVGDVAELVRDPVAVDPARTYTEIGVRSFGRGIFHKEPLPGAELGSKKVFWIRPGELVFNTVFAWEGAVSVSSEAECGKIGSHRFMTYLIDDQVADLSYLYYYFCSEPGLAVIVAASPGSAGRNRTLGIKAFAAQQIQLPSLDEQRRIVAKLNKALTELPEALCGLTRLESGLPESLYNFLLKHKDEAFARDFLELNLRPSKVVEGKVFDIVGVYSFGRGVFRRNSVTSNDTKYKTLFEVRNEDFMLSRLKAFEGAVAVADEKVDRCFVSQEFPTFQINRSICDPRYLNYLCRWPSFWSRLASGSKGVGSRRERVSAQTLLATRLPLPSLARQEQVLSVLDQGAGKFTDLLIKRQRLVRALRSALLNAAFSGQL
jgi:type I restriction enzyme S subunit